MKQEGLDFDPADMGYPWEVGEFVSLKCQAKCMACEVRFNPAASNLLKVWKFSGGWIFCPECFAGFGDEAKVWYHGCVTDWIRRGEEAQRRTRNFEPNVVR